MEQMDQIQCINHSTPGHGRFYRAFQNVCYGIWLKLYSLCQTTFSAVFSHQTNWFCFQSLPSCAFQLLPFVMHSSDMLKTFGTGVQRNAPTSRRNSATITDTNPKLFSDIGAGAMKKKLKMRKT